MKRCIIILMIFLFFILNTQAQLTELDLDIQATSKSDEFEFPCSLYDWTDVSDYEGWNATHLEVKDVDVSNEGELTMMPYTTAWFANYRSTLLYKEVSGDFTFTTNVIASNRAETGMPSRLYSLAGLMVRTPRDTLAALNNWQTGMANYVFMALGFAATNHPSCSGCQGPHFEVKSTTNSSSNLRVSSLTGLEAEVRMVRINDAILVLYKTPGNDYILHQRYYRPDMPDTVQIGFVTYTDWPNVSGQNPYSHNSQDQSFQPDLIGRFDYGRVDELTVPMDLANTDFHLESEVSDQLIEDEFGYDTNYTGRLDWKIWKGTQDGDWTNPLNWSGAVLPTSSDSILIPNCSCPEVTYPSIAVGSYTYPSLVLEQEAQLSVQVDASIIIDVATANAVMNNEGSILNQGTFSVINMGTKAVVNTGTIECEGICQFED